MTAIDDLDLLYGDTGDPDEYGDDAPPPRNVEEADRHLRLAGRAERRHAELEALFDAQIAALQARKAEVLAPLERESLRRRALVERWHRVEFAAGRAKPTMHLPHGTSKLREAQPRVTVVDPDAFRAWCETEQRLDLLLPPKPAAPSLQAIKKQLSIPDGEPGAQVPVVDPGTAEAVPGVVAVHQHPHSTINTITHQEPTEDPR